MQHNFYQNPNDAFGRSRKTHPKIHMEFQENQKSKTILTENKVGQLSLSSFKTYYKSTVIKIAYGTGIRII